MSNQMEWTGERLVTDETLGKGVIEHLHRYAVAQMFSKGKRVLDIASGEGYGSNLLSKNAAFVYGVDISEEAVLHATQKYASQVLQFKVGSTSSIPLPDASVDVVVSFETLEHHDQHQEMMKEIKRVLVKDGILIISTPEREIYRKVDPGNIYHIKELDLGEFKSLISEYFKETIILHQLYVHGSFLFPEKNAFNDMIEYNGDFSETNALPIRGNQIYNIAIASDLPFGENGKNISIFNGEKNMFQFIEKIAESNVKEGMRIIQSSASYKLGSLILRPIKKIKSFFK